MRKIAEIRKELSEKVAEVKAIDSNNAEAVEKGINEVNALVRELEQANAIEAAEQKAAERKIEQVQKRAGRSFSLLRMIKDLSEGRELSGLEAEVAEMGSEEYRRLGLTAQGVVVPSALLRAASGQNVDGGTASEGANLKEQMSSIYVEELKKKLVVAQLGATVLTDLTGTLPVITSAQISASWGAEAAQASFTKAAYAKATMTPHRNMVCVAVTKDLLCQTSFDVEADLVKKITEAHANLIEAAAIAGTGSNSQPTGILSHASVPVVAMGTNGGNITWGKTVELETTINGNDANRGSMAYLTSPKVWGNLKTIAKASNTASFILENGVVNGYRADFSSLVPSNLTKGTASGTCSAMIFGNFNDLYIGQWGGLDIVVDPYTSKRTGEVEICLNAWNDVLVAEPKSFAVIKDITIA